MKRLFVEMILLGGVVGRRGIDYTASSLRPCQKHPLNAYKKWSTLLVLFLVIGSSLPVLSADTTPPPAVSNTPGTTSAIAPTAPAPMTDIHDIRPPVPVGFDIPPWLLPTLIALAVVGLLAALFLWWRRHRKKRTIETVVPELPPDMVAMQALDAIGDVRGQDGKTFYFRLSAILRQYVFGRFGVGAPEMTTEEFLPCIGRLPVARDLSRQLKKLCKAMEPVKFAGEKTMEKQMEEDLFFVRGFVRQTTQEADPESPSETSAEPPALPQAERKG